MKEDGGPAFPRPAGWGKDAWYDGAKGLTLRDYFAAKAMQGLLSTSEGLNSVDKVAIVNKKDPLVATAEIAYAYADAMLKAREQ